MKHRLTHMHSIHFNQIYNNCSTIPQILFHVNIYYKNNNQNHSAPTLSSSYASLFFSVLQDPQHCTIWIYLTHSFHFIEHITDEPINENFLSKLCSVEALQDLDQEILAYKYFSTLFLKHTHFGWLSCLRYPNLNIKKYKEG